MCGIFGFYASSPLASSRLDALIRVANSQVARGHHAFGLAWSNEDQQTFSFKRPGAVVDHPDDVARGEGAVGLIGHTRWATHGSADDNSNNHPHQFRFGKTDGYLVHNGIVGNYESIARQRGLDLRSECDSEVLARHIEAGKEGLLPRVAAAVADVDAYAPCVVAVITRAGLVLARRGNPLFWSDDRDVVWFASTPDGLPGRVREVPDECAYGIPLDGEGAIRELRLRSRRATTMRFVGSDLFA